MRMIPGLILLLAACTTHEVRCDSRLERINAPAAASAGSGTLRAPPGPVAGSLP